MIATAIFQTVEFYVVMTLLAAAVVGLCVRPSGRGEAETLFVQGVLGRRGREEGEECGKGVPCIVVEVGDDLMVRIRRYGLAGATTESRVTLAITKIGFDIAIKERRADVPGGGEADMAVFQLDFLGSERYHVSYEVEEANLFASMTLAVKPGIRIDSELKR